MQARREVRSARRPPDFAAANAPDRLSGLSACSVSFKTSFATVHRGASQAEMVLPSVVSAVAATSCQVQVRFPRAYLYARARLVSDTSRVPASSGTASRLCVPAGTSVSHRFEA